MKMNDIRPAAVAGTFYPGDPETLGRTVSSLLAEVQAPAGVPKALIAPHAGYIYSGPVAAHAYARLKAARDTIRRVVLLGPAHHVPVNGLALPDADAFATPLGIVPVDAAAVESLTDLPQVCVSPSAHLWEHSLEVQLPFLQTVLADFKLVPLAVGDAEPEEVAEVLERVWGGEETLIVVSSDLSHYLDYAEAGRQDQATVADILDLRTLQDYNQACGRVPINGLLCAARRRRLRPELLDARNSDDTAGDKRRVVGYAAFAFYEPDER